ncbi:MAG: HAD-IA family hydrolase [Acidimicrobiia bacterium]|nr:HAD-IA family hydrolase [Acidimicrobiia bacterium]
MVSAVLFDFGGVILSSPFEAFARFERDNGLPPDLIRTINATNADHNAWAKLERSDVTIDEFCRLFEQEAAAMGHEVRGEGVLACLSGDVRPAMVEALRRIRGRLPLALLTNNMVSAGPDADHVSELTEIMALFDVVVESSKVGVRKPEVQFYEIACRQLGVAPPDCVFLDDLGVNLKPARAMGMTTIKVVDPTDALRQLEQVVGFPLSGGS